MRHRKFWIEQCKECQAYINAAVSVFLWQELVSARQKIRCGKVWQELVPARANKSFMQELVPGRTD